MQYRFKGPGKYVVSPGNGGAVSTIKPGQIIEMEKTPSGVWASKFEAVLENAPQPSAEELAAQEGAAEEARLMAELEAEAARVQEANRQRAEENETVTSQPELAATVTE